MTIAKTCPRCGGSRGDPYCGTVREDGEIYDVHNWDNPCGHIDYYPDVLIEAGIHPPRHRR